jgi:thiol-disulfide isomerase/thioredoxin
MRIVALTAAAVLGLAGRSMAEGLSVGDAAPSLSVKEFVKGDAVKEFEKGKLYVVEFWATWCGPCRTSIPHLTELQKKNKDVVFIGVSVWENKPDAVKPFVEEMGDKMAYRVAADVSAAGKPDGPGEGVMAKTWMQAAGQGGIPTAFIVNGDGKIAWIGHPMQMDKPLEQIVAGKWDLAVAAADFKKAQARQAKMAALMPKLRKAQADPKELLTVLDEAIKDDASMEEVFAGLKFQTLIKSGDTGAAADYGTKLIEGQYKDNQEGLNQLAWTLVEKPGDKPDPKLMKFALKAAERADKLAEGKSGAIADTLAKAQFENGDAAKAVETQERALKLAKGTPLEKDASMAERLEQYKKAAKK